MKMFRLLERTQKYSAKLKFCLYTEDLSHEKFFKKIKITISFD